MKFIPLFGCALLITCPALSGVAAAQGVSGHPRVAQARELARVWLDAQRDFQEIPGLSVAVVHDQDVIWSDAFGYADPARKVAAAPNTIYSICSISKLFTSIGIMQQRDAGKLRLDDPIAKHLSWFNISGRDPEAPEITVEGLLTHSAGLPRESAHPYWTGPDFVFPTREQIISELSKQEPLYSPATYFQYSNLGLTLAGEVLAAVAGESYDSYIRRNILSPLALTSTFPEMPEQERGKRLAVGHTSISRAGTRKPVTFFQAKGIAPAAGFASTAEDLARFAAWHFRLRTKGGREVLSANTLREMQRVHWLDPDWQTHWGLGYAIERSGDKTFVGHGGSCPGFRSQLLMNNPDKVATVVMANAQGISTNNYAERLHDIFLPAIKAAVADSARKIAARPELANYAGIYDLGFAGELAIVAWEDGLASLGLPTEQPVRALGKWRKVGEHTFRRVRSDGALGEAIVFAMGRDGRPTHLTLHNNIYRKIR